MRQLETKESKAHQNSEPCGVTVTGQAQLRRPVIDRPVIDHAPPAQLVMNEAGPSAVV